MYRSERVLFVHIGFSHSSLQSKVSIKNKFYFFYMRDLKKWNHSMYFILRWQIIWTRLLLDLWNGDWLFSIVLFLQFPMKEWKTQCIFNNLALQVLCPQKNRFLVIHLITGITPLDKQAKLKLLKKEWKWSLLSLFREEVRDKQTWISSNSETNMVLKIACSCNWRFAENHV